MGDGEMALVPGVQYGLSSHSYPGEQKSLIFTKLTDSAYRTIQEYLKNRNKHSQKPTIQFLGNEGQLSIPSSHGSAEFNFTLFNSQDVEGPQSGFECVQQVAHKNLENLGNLSYKMRIQANDDVYETTRHRMAVAEENNKNKCTRVIKANGPDIGRKVKVKGTGRIIPPPYSKHRESMTTIPTSGSSQSKASTSKPAASNNSSSNHPAATRSPEKKISDLMRRPIKERLIHLLAVRPYKKPEIYDRIIREGIRDRERSIIMTVLKQVSTVRDNAYELQRHFWNDVQEDWPFYNDQERSMLKRRKPQNLTPPASDGGSSGSGHSPNSIHAGSPPAITAPPASLQNNKRPGYYQGSDGLPTKKPRISHYRRPEPISFVSSGTLESSSGGSSYNNNNSSVVSATTVSGDRAADSNSACGANSNSADNKSDSLGDLLFGVSRQQTQRERNNSRVDYRAERITNSDVLRDTGSSYAAATTAAATAVAAISDSSLFNRPSCLTSSSSGSARSSSHHQSGHSRDSGVPTTSGSAAEGSGSNEVNADRRDKSDRSRSGAREERNRERESRYRNATAATLGTNAHNEASNSGALTYNANSTNNNANATVSDVAAAAAAAGLQLERPDNLVEEYPDYLTHYTTVNSMEQKRRYKAVFCALYDEYIGLYDKVSAVGNHFTNLLDMMKQQYEKGNTAMAQMYRDKIHRDYDACKRNVRHQQLTARFNYLHAKLSHIKKLILEYETAIASNNGTANVTSDGGTNATNIGGVDSRHY